MQLLERRDFSRAGLMLEADAEMPSLEVYSQELRDLQQQRYLAGAQTNFPGPERQAELQARRADIHPSAREGRAAAPEGSASRPYGRPGPAGRWRAQALSRPGRKAGLRLEQRQRKETLLSKFIVCNADTPRTTSGECPHFKANCC
jgi:hypothetical protein